MKRIVIGAIVGGLVVFVWGGFSHMVLLKGTGFSPLPNEGAVLESLASARPGDGLYFFPGIDLAGDPTPEQQAVWEARYASGPTGLLLYHPKGGAPMSPGQLLIELLSNVLASAVAALLVALMVARYWQRVLAIALLGVFAWLSLSASYWNWYGFPDTFILAEGIDQAVGWFFGGLTIAGIVPPAQSA